MPFHLRVDHEELSSPRYDGAAPCAGGVRGQKVEPLADLDGSEVEGLAVGTRPAPGTTAGAGVTPTQHRAIIVVAASSPNTACPKGSQ